MISYVLGDEEESVLQSAVTSDIPPYEVPRRARTKVERIKSHKGRKAGYKSTIAERLHADIKLDLIIMHCSLSDYMDCGGSGLQ
jgi:hypothetical protein